MTETFPRHISELRRTAPKTYEWFVGPAMNMLQGTISKINALLHNSSPGLQYLTHLDATPWPQLTSIREGSSALPDSHYERAIQIILQAEIYGISHVLHTLNDDDLARFHSMNKIISKVTANGFSIIFRTDRPAIHPLSGEPLFINSQIEPSIKAWKYI